MIKRAALQEAGPLLPKRCQNLHPKFAPPEMGEKAPPFLRMVAGEAA